MLKWQVTQAFCNEATAAIPESSGSSFRTNGLAALKAVDGLAPSPKGVMHPQSHAQTFRGATSFSRSLKKNMSYRELNSSSGAININSSNQQRMEPFLMAPQEIRTALEHLEVQRMNQFEFEEMFEEAIAYMKTCTIEHSDLRLVETTHIEGERTSFTESEQPCIPLPFLIAGSETFRQKMLRLETDSIFCSLMMSGLGSFISSEQMRILAKGGKEKEMSRVGIKTFSSKQDDDVRRWFFILSGKLKVSLDLSALPFGDEAAEESFEIGVGEYFGGFGIQKHEAGWSHIIVETKEATKLIELQGACLEAFSNKYESSAKILLARMGGG